MEYRTRDNRTINGNDGQDRFLSALYGHPALRWLVGLLVRPAVSKAGGFFLDTGISRLLIPSFVKKNHIDMSEYEQRKYYSYNDFFTRRIIPGKRMIDRRINRLIAPCDGKLSVYPITGQTTLTIKGTRYTVSSLLRDEKLAARYAGGYALVFRLTVDDYHHFFYPEKGKKSPNRRIPGVYHTVNPAAAERFPIYRENTREYGLIKTENFGTILQMEVGALMVGRIVNFHEDGYVLRGEEKGFFEFGGSTVILLLQKDKAVIDPDICANTDAGFETIVKAGEAIGRAVTVKRPGRGQRSRGGAKRQDYGNGGKKP